MLILMVEQHIHNKNIISYTKMEINLIQLRPNPSASEDLTGMTD